MQSFSHIITANKPTTSFLQAGCPSCCPTNSVKTLKEKYHIPWTEGKPKLEYFLENRLVEQGRKILVVGMLEYNFNQSII